MTPGTHLGFAPDGRYVERLKVRTLPFRAPAFLPFALALHPGSQEFAPSAADLLPSSTIKPPAKEGALPAFALAFARPLLPPGLGQTLRFAAALIAVWDSCFLALPIPLRPPNLSALSSGI